jgi:uncharacterized membrane protein YkoI
MDTKLILPGSAGVIALTALLGFVEGNYQQQDDAVTRKSIALINGLTEKHGNLDSVLSRHENGKESAKPIYLVKISCGESSHEVLINAQNGQVITTLKLET